MEQIQAVIFDNLFAELRRQHFNSEETFIPVSPYKQRKIEQYLAIANHVGSEYDKSETYHLVSKFQERIRVRIFDEERHAIDTSVETLQLLNIIIYNIGCMNSEGISIQGVVKIGHYLRQQGHRVDFVKLDAWISRLFIKRAVSLLSSVLLYIFNFETDELPFLYRKYPNVHQIVCSQILRTANSGKQTGSASVNLKYTPMSSLSAVIQKITNTLGNIEE